MRRRTTRIPRSFAGFSTASKEDVLARTARRRRWRARRRSRGSVEHARERRRTSRGEMGPFGPKPSCCCCFCSFLISGELLGLVDDRHPWQHRMERLLHHGAQLVVLTRQLVVGDALQSAKSSSTTPARTPRCCKPPCAPPVVAGSERISTEVQSDRRLVDDFAQRLARAPAHTPCRPAERRASDVAGDPRDVGPSHRFGCAKLEEPVPDAPDQERRWALVAAGWTAVQTLLLQAISRQTPAPPVRRDVDHAQTRELSAR